MGEVSQDIHQRQPLIHYCSFWLSYRTRHIHHKEEEQVHSYSHANATILESVGVIMDDLDVESVFVICESSSKECDRKGRKTISFN